MNKEIIQKTLILDENEFYVKHLSIINVFLPVSLTKKEIDILAAIMSMKGDISRDRFGPTARKIIMEKFNLSQGGISNYLKSMKEKGFINEFNEILPILHPKSDNQPYMFKLVKKK
jgi:DNA-binding MarR family transcriptional regulator